MPQSGTTASRQLAYLALGSNLGDRQGHLTAARLAISELPHCTVRQVSSLYETPAWGSATPQADYLNAVMAIDTQLGALELRRRTAEIESALGRTRGEKNAARTLDIDVLLFGNIEMNTSILVIPHPRMHLRKFVLQPLLEIAPEINIPGLGAAQQWLEKITDDDAKKVSQNSSWI